MTARARALTSSVVDGLGTISGKSGPMRALYHGYASNTVPAFVSDANDSKATGAAATTATLAVPKKRHKKKIASSQVCGDCAGVWMLIACVG
jgi:hypothetical protein